MENFFFWIKIFLIIHYVIAIYCIYDMVYKHKIKRKWRFFWIPCVLLFSIGIILYFIFRKELQIEEQLN